MPRNSVSMEMTMVVTQSQEELQNLLDKEVKNIKTSENVVSHAVDERNVPKKDYVEPDSGEGKMLNLTVVKKKNLVESNSGEEKDNTKFENCEKNGAEI